jgi:hypothetical protein
VRHHPRPRCRALACLRCAGAHVHVLPARCCCKRRPHRRTIGVAPDASTAVGHARAFASRSPRFRLRCASFSAALVSAPSAPTILGGGGDSLSPMLGPTPQRQPRLPRQWNLPAQRPAACNQAGEQGARQTFPFAVDPDRDAAQCARRPLAPAPLRLAHRAALDNTTALAGSRCGNTLLLEQLQTNAAS